jgi:hypothetical protein
MSATPEIPDRPPDITASLSITPEGGIRTSYSGPAQSNEEGSESAAIFVVSALNRRGGQWSPPEPPQGPESGADFVSTGPAGTLRMQVTRVPRDHQHWRRLRDGDRVSAEVDRDRAARELADAIRRKSRRLSADVKRETVLILDATSSFEHAFEQSLDAFDEKYVESCRDCGFAEVWVVGLFNIDRLLPGPMERIR